MVTWSVDFCIEAMSLSGEHKIEEEIVISVQPV